MPAATAPNRWTDNAARTAPADSAAKTLRWFLAVLVATLAGLLLLGHDVLLRPPYDDAAAGNWNEAAWLAENDFNYWRLRYEVPHNLEHFGSARSYMISVQPTLLALGMRWRPSTRAVIVAQHIWGLTCGALIVALTFAILREKLGTLVALLGGLAVLTTPLLSVQVALAGTDVPLTAAALGAALLVDRQRWSLAAVATFLAFLMKATGLVVTAALVGLLIVRWLSAAHGDRPRTHDERRALRLALAALGLELALLAWAGKPPIPWELGNIEWLQFSAVRYVCPDVVLLALVALAAVLWAICLGVRQQPGSWFTRSARILAGERREVLSPVVPFACLLLACLLVILQMALFVPRYLTISVPFLYVVLLSSAAMLRPLHVLIAPVLALATVANLLNSDGRLFPDVPQLPRPLREGDGLQHRLAFLLERSHEHALDHRSYINLFRLLDERYHNELILVDRPLNFYLQPALGYVTSSLPHAHYIDECFPGSPQFDSEVRAVLAEGTDEGPILVHVESHAFDSPSSIPPPLPTDDTLFDDGQPSPVIAYRVPWPAARPSPDQVVEEYFRRLPPDKGPRLVLAHAMFLLERGRPDQAIRQLQDALARFPWQLELHQMLVLALHQAGRVDAARKQIAEMQRLGLISDAEAARLTGELGAPP